MSDGRLHVWEQVEAEAVERGLVEPEPDPYQDGYEQGMEEALHMDLTRCPWYMRRFVGGDGICSFGCETEPECQTCEPSGGWPEARRIAAAVAHALGQPVELPTERGAVLGEDMEPF